MLGPELLVMETDQPAPLPCVERHLPGFGPTWVHGYTFAEAAAWRKWARNLAGGVKPGDDHLALAQVIWVCRRGPNAPQRSFVLAVTDGPNAFARLAERLPGAWVEAACREADELSLEGYYPPPLDAAPSAAADARLGELLADEDAWRSLSLLSVKLFGVPLEENGRPLGGVLALLQSEQAARRQLLAAFGAMAGAAG